MSKKFITTSAKETQALAKKFAKELRNNVIALTGLLGAGKTTFAAGFAQGLGVKGKIISPTFIMIRQYPIAHSHKIFYHIDLYRIEDERDLVNSALKEIIENPSNIVLVEWPEKAQKILKDALKISLEIVDENTRKIILHDN